jgi:hypothetical protein
MISFLAKTEDSHLWALYVTAFSPWAYILSTFLIFLTKATISSWTTISDEAYSILHAKPFQYVTPLEELQEEACIRMYQDYD